MFGNYIKVINNNLEKQTVHRWINQLLDKQISDHSTQQGGEQYNNVEGNNFMKHCRKINENNEINKNVINKGKTFCHRTAGYDQI